MKICILAADGYEDQELWYPKFRFLEEGFSVVVAGDGEKKSKYGYPVTPDLKVSKLKAADFDCVIIPGGIKGSENLRMNKAVTDFVRQMHHDGKIIGSICHGAWVLISSIPVKGKKLTCYKGMKDDLIAAGARYEGSEVVVDQNIVTSRMPSDLPAFTKTILKKLR